MTPSLIHLLLKQLLKFNSQLNNIHDVSYNQYLFNHISRRFQLMYKSILMIFFFLMFLSLADATNIQLKTKQIYTYNQTANTYANYTLTVPDTVGNSLLITVTTNTQTSVDIYISTDPNNTEPQSSNHTYACYSMNIVTCGFKITDDNKPKVVYFSVYASHNTTTSIDADLFDTYSLKIGKYKVTFNNSQTVLLELTNEGFQNFTNLTLLADYSTYNTAGKFDMIASLDVLPASSYHTIYSSTVGAFQRLLKLPNSGSAAPYYIVIEAENSTQIDLQLMPSNNSLYINNTKFDIVYDDTNLTFNHVFGSAPSNPLFVQLNAFSGIGKFNVDYCDGLEEFTYQNTNGQNGEIYIPATRRQRCFNNSGGLLIENFVVEIANIGWKFSYSVGIYEGNYPLYVMPQQKTYGIIAEGVNFRDYQLLISSNINVFIQCDILSLNGKAPNVTFALFQCLSYTQSKGSNIKQGKNCTSTLINPGSINSYSLANSTNYSYIHVQKVNSQDQFAQFVIQLTIPAYERSILTLNKVSKGIVSMNGYDYYTLPVASLGLPANSVISVTATAINGQIVMLGSIKEDTPTFNMIYSQNSTVQYAWDGQLFYVLNDSLKNIYIGILGDSQSLYQIQASLDNDADISLRYKKLIQNRNNEINLVGNNVSYLMYNSHSIPYYISFYPIPTCIRYGFSLPLNKACVQLPAQFHEPTVYIQIQQNQASQNDTFKFNVYAFSEFLYLTPDKPIWVSCENSCYEIVYLITKGKENVSIIHQGEGSIAINGTQTQYSNTFMILQCKDDSSCIFVLNASILYSGQMQISYASTAGVQIKWNTNSFVWSNTPKHLYLKIRKFSEINGFLIYSQGLTPSIFMNVFPIQDNYTNAINFTYPTNTSYMLTHQSNPLRRMQIVNMKQEDLKNSGCYDNFVYCLVTISLYVNHTQQYDMQYAESGIGYFASNNYEYYLPFNMPFRMSNTFSLSYFQVSFPDQVLFGRLNLKPISNCRPYILGDQGQTIYTDALAFAVEKKVNFSIVSNDRCLYYITLSTSFYRTLVPSVLYQMAFIRGDQNKFIQFIYDYLLPGTTIVLSIQGLTQSQASSLTIYAKQNANGSKIQLPTNQSYDYISQGKSNLTINSLPSSTTIGFRIKAHVGIALSSLSLMVRQDTKPMILIHNQEQIAQLRSQNQSLNFQFFSSSNFLLFLDISAGPVQLLIQRNGNTIINQTKDRSSDPWVAVNTSSASIRQYDISLTSKTDNQENYPIAVRLHTQEQGNFGLLSLYNGVVLVDAFTMYKSTNCYAYHSSALVGVENLSLDITFASNVKQDSISYSATIADGIIKSSIKYIGGNTFRITVPFQMLADYNFCFTLEDYSLIGKQFYIMIDMADMPHLPIGTSLKNISDKSYQVYEMVNIKPKPVTLRTHIVNCFGATQVQVSNSYSEMLAGKYSHAFEEWIDKDNMITLSSMPPGYFYLGLKASNNTTYKVMTAQVADNYTIGASKWGLSTTVITNIAIDHQDVVIQLPKIVPLFSKAKFAYLKYQIYIHDPKQNAASISSQILPKCPELFQNNQYRNYSQQYVSSKDAPVFRIKIADLPHQFNLSAKVQLFDETQKLSTPYYYDTTAVKINNSGWGFIPILIFFTCGFSICCCGAAYTMYRRHKNKKRNEITFEMSPYDQTISSPQQSKKVALHDKKGYGQFVEEVI